MSAEGGQIKTLLVWGHPRTRSTVLERPFLTRSDVEVIHEPLTEARYLGPERTNFQIPADVIASNWSDYKHATWDACWERATVPSKGYGVLFTKELAKTIFRPVSLGPNSVGLHEDGNPTVIATEKLLAPHIVHVFLIRNPKDYMVSFVEKLSDPILGPGFFDREEIGIHQSRRLYDFVASHEKEPPIIIDSDDLLAKPGVVIEHLCQRVGLDYTPEMLTWEAGEHKAADLFAKWKGMAANLTTSVVLLTGLILAGWHDTALHSTGIMPILSPSEKKQPSLEVAEAIADNTPDFEYLKSKAYKFA